MGQVAEIGCKVADLTELRQELALLISTCAVGTVADYRIVEALAPTT